MTRLNAAIVGSGNIGSDLLIKLLHSDAIAVTAMVGIDPDSDGLRQARERGVETSSAGVDWLLAMSEPPDLVFDATSAHAHLANAPRYRDAGIQAVDLTPAALGPFVVPSVNLTAHWRSPNLNLISCGGQATIPIVAAISQVTRVPYAEIVATIASRSAGPGTRSNIDEFTRTTARGIEAVGGAERGRAIILLNPAEPPITMRNSVFCAIEPDADRDAVIRSVLAMVEAVSAYVPGYKLRGEPQIDDPRPDWGGMARVTTLLEVTGAGDYLPPHAGNLDIMTAAATQVGERLATNRTS